MFIPILVGDSDSTSTWIATLTDQRVATWPDTKSRAASGEADGRVGAVVYGLGLETAAGKTRSATSSTTGVALNDFWHKLVQ